MREFEFDREFVAADGLIYAGKRYVGGESFSRRGIPDGELWDLWAMGRIDALPRGAKPEPDDAELERLTAPSKPGKTARR